jgi:hypothetical protein
MSHFFDLEFDHWMVSRMRVLGLTSFTKIKIRASTALETNACDGGLLAPVTGDPSVDNLSTHRLPKLK